MKRLSIFLFAAMLCLTAKAQQMEELTSWNQTFKSQLTEKQVQERYDARIREERMQGGVEDGASIIISVNKPMGKSGLEILPDTLYAGEPFDVHYILADHCEATYELYDLRGKRPKRIATKYASTQINGSAVLRITIDEPGAYEIVAYVEAWLMDAQNPELHKSRWKIDVFDRKASGGE